MSVLACQDEGRSSKCLPRRDLTFPEDSSIDGDTFDLTDDDDNGSGNTVPAATGPSVLLVAEEKSERSVPELASLGGVLLLEATGIHGQTV
ncbi:uncharacterized protein FPOAC1_012933 [Fusarium poae]|uniref:uncharacterized protein n=1 Tax=Fusarium poae TaxID=36050 RepID=UPI001D049515|nr:uncharacterized protein FPOAC1_012933 [Fusarium poae]KAG8664956.1 hypothetical protein FPOAC1_012933 [Fusarium poae]